MLGAPEVSMTRRTLTIAAVTNVILVAVFWWGRGPNTATTVALTATVVIATVVILFVVFRSARLIPHDARSSPYPPHRADVEFRDRGDRFGPP
jgi:hypothetical protein